MLTVYMPGVWDLLHVGHLAVLQRAKSLGDYLVVGVPTDEVVREDKERYPIIPAEQRVGMLRGLSCVDEAELYYRLEFITHLNRFNPDILAVGSRWGSDRRHRDAEDWVNLLGRKIITLPYTDGVSTTNIIKRVLDERARSAE